MILVRVVEHENNFIQFYKQNIDKTHYTFVYFSDNKQNMDFTTQAILLIMYTGKL